MAKTGNNSRKIFEEKVISVRQTEEEKKEGSRED